MANPAPGEASRHARVMRRAIKAGLPAFGSTIVHAIPIFTSQRSLADLQPSYSSAAAPDSRRLPVPISTDEPSPSPLGIGRCQRSIHETVILVDLRSASPATIQQNAEIRWDRALVKAPIEQTSADTTSSIFRTARQAQEPATRGSPWHRAIFQLRVR